MEHHPAVIVHGGAWNIPDQLLTATKQGVKAAALKAIKILDEGGSALDAVQAAITSLEDDPNFDAGTGSSLTADGQVEMDAVIMDGRQLQAGGVACVTNIAHPIQLARLVMDKTPHTLLAGDGANEFARQQGIETLPVDQLITKYAKEELDAVGGQFANMVDGFYNSRSKAASDRCHDNVHDHETVGAVAIDSQRNVACGTSTGGITGKRPGRVGDCPLVGAGGYADNEVGALSSTGHGESITKVCLAHHAITLMKQGRSGQEAIQEALESMFQRLNACGGLIVIDSRTGDTAHYCTSERMVWASASRGLLRHGADVVEDFVEPY